LEGSGGTADKIRSIADGAYRVSKKILYDKDPVKLVERVLVAIKKEKQKTGV
jgi:hypothetical protein